MHIGSYKSEFLIWRIIPFLSIVANYLDTATFKTSTKFYKTTLPSDITFTKADASTSDEQVENLTRE